MCSDTGDSDAEKAAQRFERHLESDLTARLEVGDSVMLADFFVGKIVRRDGDYLYLMSEEQPRIRRLALRTAVRAVFVKDPSL